MKMVRIEKWFINSQRHAERVISRAENLLRFADVKENQQFLDVGCGNGDISKYVARKYSVNVTGIDIDPEQVQLAQKGIDDILNIHFLAADATNLPFPDNDFDIVLSIGVTHHISNWMDALREIKRVLKPKGYFIYGDLMYSKVLARFGRSFKHSYGVMTEHDVSSFIQENHLSTIHASLKKSLIWNWWEAVYQRN